MTNLSLDYRGKTSIKSDKRVLLPHLDNLYVAGYWGFISCIDAPGLEKLTLCGNVVPRDDPRNASVSTDPVVAINILGSPTIHPRNLRISKVIPEKAILKLLGVWTELRELHITCPDYPWLDDTIKEELVSGLNQPVMVGQAEERRFICPRLEKLVVLASFPLFFTEEYEMKREEMAKKLGGIIEAREVGGALDHVSFGFYPVNRDSAQRDIRRELWNTEGVRLL